MSNTKKIIDVCCNVIRFTPLGSPTEWAKGDFTATYSDGTKSDCHYKDYLTFNGLPWRECQSIEIDPRS